VGLDPEPGRLPPGFSPDIPGLLAFNRMAIEATRDLVCAYKPNLAFYEALGPRGWGLLEATLTLIPPHVPTIGDGKRGDTPNTSRLYAEALFGTLGFDSATVSPYMGTDSLAPFLDWEGKGVWVLCRTSNPGASELQELQVAGPAGPEPLYLRALRLALAAPARAAVGLVVGATSPEDLQLVRRHAPEAPLLIPGVGAQGGDLRAAARAATGGPVVINASRSVLYGPESGDPAVAVRARALDLRDRINAAVPE
jgi:orotidine-5'-phosphate decarboxylase